MKIYIRYWNFLSNVLRVMVWLCGQHPEMLGWLDFLHRSAACRMLAWLSLRALVVLGFVTTHFEPTKKAVLYAVGTSLATYYIFCHDFGYAVNV
jgi:hypothetical protein